MVRTTTILHCDRCQKVLGPAPVTVGESPAVKITVMLPGRDVAVVAFDDVCPGCLGRLEDLLAAVVLKAAPVRERRHRSAKVVAVAL